MTVLVLDGAERASLSMVRSLGKRGVNVHVGEFYESSTATLSKYCKEEIIYSNPQESMTEFIETLTSIIKEFNYEIIFSSREVTTIPLSLFKSKIEEHTIVPFADWKQMESTVDKGKTFKLAEELGIPIPKTHTLNHPDELNEIKSEINYPLVVKPRSKTTWVNDLPIMMKVTKRNYVNSYETLMQVSEHIFEHTSEMPLIQEYVKGVGYGVEGLFNHGAPRAFFMHKRLREYPISGGASTLRESIHRQDMKEYAFELMESLNWHGVSMVEFKYDEKTNISNLMEINGRFWGSLPLAIAAGVDFPYLLYKMLMEGDIEPVFDYKIGVKCRWLIPGDILWFISS
ncbi:MAG: ATP-grasp domain-containing protein, partial [Thermoplasmata archaeon]